MRPTHSQSNQAAQSLSRPPSNSAPPKNKKEEVWSGCVSINRPLPRGLETVPGGSVRRCARLFAAALLLFSSGSAPAATHYVDMNSPNATPPYANWTTAATNI